MTDDQPGPPPERACLTPVAQGAAALHELYTVYVDAGFTAAQALHLVTAALTAGITQNPPQQ